MKMIAKLSAIISACLLVSSAAIAQDDGYVLEIKNIEPFTRTFAKYTYDHKPVDLLSLIRDFSESATKKSKFPYVVKSQVVAPNGSAPFQSTSKDGLGVIVISLEKILFRYFAWDTNGPTRELVDLTGTREFGTYLEFEMSCTKLNETEKTVSISCQTSPQGRVTSVSSKLGAGRKLWGGVFNFLDGVVSGGSRKKSEADYVNDISYILNLLPSSPTRQFTYDISGEYDSPYNIESILGNFDRLSEPVKGQAQLEKNKRKYNLRIGDKTYVTAIEAFPYRSGSKFTYEIKVPYLMKLDGSLDLDESKVEVLRKAVKTIMEN